MPTISTIIKTFHNSGSNRSRSGTHAEHYGKTAATVIAKYSQPERSLETFSLATKEAFYQLIENIRF